MKGTATLLMVFLFFVSGFTQELMFDVRGSMSKSIKKDQLEQANTMADIKENYPSSWITNYGLVKVQTTSNGQTLTALGRDETLSPEQKEVLLSADIGTDIVVDVSHYYSNPVTGVLEPREIHFSYTVVPHVEATYPGGKEKLDAFLKSKAIKKIPDDLVNHFDQAVFTFTVSENGVVDNVLVKKSSGDPKVDKMLLGAVKKMPKWLPAENRAGIKVKQNFQFTVGHPGC